MIDKSLLAGITILLTLSLVMTYSLSVYTVVHFHYDDFHFFIRQMIAVGVGFVMMIAVSKLDPDRWFVRLGMTLFFVSFILMAIVPFLPASLAKEVGGAKRWIQLGPMSISPVEFFKIGFVFFLGWSLTRRFKDVVKIGFFQEIIAFAPYLGLYLVSVVIIAVFQKDLGQVVVLGGTLLVMFLFVGSSLKFFMLLLSGVIGGFVSLIIAAPHRMNRIVSWWGTVQDTILSIFPFESLEQFRVEAVKEPYQISNALNAIHNGGFLGMGLGSGQFKLGYLSEVHTDFILAGIAEEMGWFGVLFVVGVFLFVIYRIFMIAVKVESPLYYLFSIGVGLLLALAFILNAFGISGVTPIKGIAVPFLSYGGSHIFAAMLAIGMVLMISKKVPRDEEGKII